MSCEDIAKKIAPILKEYEVTYAAVFGSVARGEDTPSSDVDLLVSYQKPMSLFEFGALRDKLEQILGRPVDIVSERAVNKYIRPYIERDLVEIYAQG